MLLTDLKPEQPTLLDQFKMIGRIYSLALVLFQLSFSSSFAGAEAMKNGQVSFVGG